VSTSRQLHGASQSRKPPRPQSRTRTAAAALPPLPLRPPRAAARRRLDVGVENDVLSFCLFFFVVCFIQGIIYKIRYAFTL
jgi:hypothetical protein